ncbi:hypothetical protein IHE44_0005452 [Lamprotornis superbus]|uniref:Uncharacterized protein n=1 Tax=Lamprotornis superbus TaxID=245042 RepID=A0A835NWH1_9PASS|nr:hypothetical protein IHE44_0005452 [Lamprotornis superbus]
MSVRSSQIHSCPWTKIPFSTRIRAYTQVSPYEVHVLVLQLDLFKWISIAWGPDEVHGTLVTASSHSEDLIQAH